MSPRSHHEEKAGITEQELIEAFERVVQEDYPNPERIGCPPKKVLRQSAISATRVPQSVLDHLRKCAPCLKEYDALRSGRRAKASE
jgi:hypothetical protein